MQFQNSRMYNIVPEILYKNYGVLLVFDVFRSLTIGNIIYINCGISDFSKLIHNFALAHVSMLY